jgi:hypothetical protein
VNRTTLRSLQILGLAATGWALLGASTADAVVGAPATPVSYAGVARRSTVGAGAPGVGVTPGPGVGAPGPGVVPDRDPGVGKGAPGPGVVPDRDPGVGKGAPGPGVANAGGPVNRVGVR